MKGQKGLTRREMLKLSGTVAAGSLLVACAPTVTSTVTSTLVPPTVAPTAVPPTVAPNIAPPTSVPASAGPVTLTLYDPTGSYQVTKTFAPRLDTLEGKTICLVGQDWRAAETWPIVTQLLQKQFPTAKINDTKIAYLAGSDIPGLEDKIKAAGCQGVILGNAG